MNLNVIHRASSLNTMPLLKNRSIKPQLLITGIEIIIVTALLLAGGYLEFSMLDTSKNMALDTMGS